MGDLIVAAAIGVGCTILLGLVLAVSAIKALEEADRDRDQ